MERLLGVLLVVLVVGTAVALLVRRLRPLAWVIVAAALYLPTYLAWFVLQYLRVVPVDEFFRQVFGIHSYQLVGTPLGAMVQFVPPLLPSIALLGWLWLTGRVRWSTAA